MQLLILFALALVLSSCTSPQKEAPPPDSNWAGRMQNMAEDVKKLLPFIYDGEAYRDPQNKAEILTYLREFSQAAHQIPAAEGKPFLGDDLLIEYSIKNLKEDLGRAAFALESGQIDYSRTQAKASLNHCFRCHSVTQAGNSAQWNLDQVTNLPLAPVEKADLLVATRKYDQALSYMENLLNSGELHKTRAFDFESLLRRYLALIIRIENAPQRALKEMDRVLSRDDTPHFIIEQGAGWQKSLKEWAQEMKSKKKFKISTGKDLFAEVEKRFRKAESIQHYEKDHAGDVEYLRATTALHQGMKLLKKPADQARALFLLGKAYEVLDELGSWTLHESYYEACMLKDPKSATAKSCFNRLEASLYMGYSGSAGTHLPPEERERLRRLREVLK